MLVMKTGWWPPKDDGAYGRRAASALAAEKCELGADKQPSSNWGCVQISAAGGLQHIIMLIVAELHLTGCSTSKGVMEGKVSLRLRQLYMGCSGAAASLLLA